ncbi:cytosine permease [Rhodococcus antarcticus]|uniref:Cytosine permease n=1 Tax=Rhodococcus antarcticus TaxID=2987751 RepID=A0ABY6NYF7_9NOCA|nr:cytosine permease [Rhodococcus antarcticus]UZJ24376.1 cytosine permease [Rhodococcus antarcticus]
MTHDTPAQLDQTRTEPGRTLDTDPPRTLGTFAQLGLWGNLGISLLLPVAATFLVLPGTSVASTLLAVVVGAVIGSTLLGLSAAVGARTGAPAMVLLRGLLGTRLSALPTVVNLLQCVGWATFEVFVIAEAATALTGGPRWVFVLVAGVLATGMALRPLGVVKILSRYAVWLAIASTVYLLVQVLRQPLPPLTEGGSAGFWSATDLVIALPVSWVPLAADYSRHSRSATASFVGASVGYGVATVVFFALGVFALVAYGVTPGFDVIGSLLVLPVAGVAVVVLVVDELDEAFANLYSTAVSAQNLRPGWDRRHLVIGVGVLATALALGVDAYSYEPFLYLLGAVFVPLTAVLLVAFFVLGRLGGGSGWDTSAEAPARPEMLVPWVAGFVAYQLVAPTALTGWAAGWTTWWTDRQSDLGIPTGWSASLVALAVSGVLTLAVGAVRRR